mmetsp:Transcript_73314/g.203378  ORF Transcript_73314/g.203378 Transcript_73314/m.203378 type:complete len:209 (+) Transcript_73314:1680-2306(+)
MPQLFVAVLTSLTFHNYRVSHLLDVPLQFLRGVLTPGCLFVDPLLDAEDASVDNLQPVVDALLRALEELPQVIQTPLRRNIFMLARGLLMLEGLPDVSELRPDLCVLLTECRKLVAQVTDLHVLQLVDSLFKVVQRPLGQSHMEGFPTRHKTPQHSLAAHRLAVLVCEHEILVQGEVEGSPCSGTHFRNSELLQRQRFQTTTSVDVNV